MDEPLTMERDGNTYYYHRDGLGSITEVTDEGGTLIERYEYDVYGAVAIYDGSGVTLTTSAIDNPYLFTARRYDPESGNYYYRARYYSPSLGRFLSQDPLGFDAGDYNLYRYAFNNPVNLTDPSGQIPIDTVLDVIFIAYDAVMIAGDIYKLVTSDECDKAELHLALNIDLFALGLDFLSLLTPYFTGGGLGYRLGVAGTNITVDAVRVATPVAAESLIHGIQAIIKGTQIGRTIWLAKGVEGNGGDRSGSVHSIGPHGDMKRGTGDNLDSHHVVQDAWARRKGISGYSREDAIAIRLTDTEHRAANETQRAFRRDHGWNTTLQQELQLARKALKAAGLPSKEIDAAIETAARYFASIGMR